MNDEKKLEGYKIERKIAEGAFGTVFKAIRAVDCEVILVKHKLS